MFKKIPKAVYVILVAMLIVVVSVTVFNKSKDELPATTSVKLFYYNEKKDTDDTGNIMCSENGLASVDRDIPVTNSPIKDTLDLLLKGQLTKQESTAGIGTEFPLEGVSIKSIALSQDGVLRVDISDPSHKTVGGSCRTAILANQIKATAKQFEKVTSVEFVSEEVFQP